MITRHDTVFIAGPMAGFPNNNRLAFFKTENFLKQEYDCKVLNG